MAFNPDSYRPTEAEVVSLSAMTRAPLVECRKALIRFKGDSQAAKTYLESDEWKKGLLITYRESEPEYDPRTCITAGQLRDTGVPVPAEVPDCGWVKRSSIDWSVDTPTVSPAMPFTLTIGITAKFNQPFRWVAVPVVAEKAPPIHVRMSGGLIPHPDHYTVKFDADNTPYVVYDNRKVPITSALFPREISPDWGYTVLTIEHINNVSELMKVLNHGQEKAPDL